MAEINNQLPKNVAEFCAMFPPSARLCRFVNRKTGTLLDIREDLNDVPCVVGNQESNGVQYWLITPYGNGQAIIPVPKDGSQKVRYLTPSSTTPASSATLSPFPTSWIILPTAECPAGDPLVGYTVPKGLYEEWTCLINWPHFSEARMLDLANGSAKPNSKVGTWVVSSTQWQYWRVQFIRYKQDGADSIPPILPNYSGAPLNVPSIPSESTSGSDNIPPSSRPTGIINSAKLN